MLRPLPAEMRHDRRDAALIGGAEPVDLLEVAARARDLQDGGLAHRVEEDRDRFFPSIALKTIFLLGDNAALLEVAIGPPWHASTIKFDRFRKELIALSVQTRNVDLTGH